MATDVGRQLAKAQRRIHSQRRHIARLRSLIHNTAREFRQIQADLRKRENVALANERLIAALRAGASHGIVIREGEDRLEGMALIVQKVREHNLEQHRALTQLVSAASYLLWGWEKPLDVPSGNPLAENDEREDKENLLVSVDRLESLLVAYRGGQGVLNGSKSLIARELARQQEQQQKWSDETKDLVIRWTDMLVNRRGPVRKRDLKQLRDRLTNTARVTAPEV